MDLEINCYKSTTTVIVIDHKKDGMFALARCYPPDVASSADIDTLNTNADASGLVQSIRK